MQTIILNRKEVRKMAVLSHDDFMSAVKGLAGDNADDNTLTMIENFTDTYNDLEARASDTNDWKTKYEQNDNEWREKYKARFFEGKEGTDPTTVMREQKEDITDDGKDISFDDLFKEREG
ncbi:MAG: hypothetical protein [Bacteriophage sp.]|nr:MAG: hypothetical protein [Bacteriophage sp.]